MKTPFCQIANSTRAQAGGAEAASGSIVSLMRKRASYGTLVSRSRPGHGPDSPRRMETPAPIPNSVQLEFAGNARESGCALADRKFIRDTALCGRIAGLLAFEYPGCPIKVKRMHPRSRRRVPHDTADSEVDIPGGSVSYEQRENCALPWESRHRPVEVAFLTFTVRHISF
jgi:hypothetical protein